MVIAKGSERGNENKEPREKKQGLFVKVFKFCRPLPISSNYPHFTLCFLNENYLHPSGMELQRASWALPITHQHQPPTSECISGSGAHSSPYCQAWFNTQRCTVHCSGTRTNTVLQLLCLFKYNFSFLDQCLTYTPQPGHPPGCVQGQERARRGYSAETGSDFQAGSFASSLRATLWLVPLSLPAIHAAGSDPMSLLPSCASDCFVAKDFSRKLRRRVRNSAH